MAMTAWDKLTPNQTLIRAAHIEKFRAALTAEFNRRGVTTTTPFTTDAVAGKPIKAIHIQELRDKLQTVKTTTYSDNPVQPNQTVIKPEHFDQIGTMINLLEAAPQVGGTTSCNAGCMGLCVSCVGTCVGSCTSCTSCSGCSGTCSGGCYTACSGCSGTCSAMCASNCSNTCINGCYKGCQGSCSGGCYTACTGCTSGCTGCSGCGNNCTGGCISGCANICYTACVANCRSANYQN